MQNIIGKLFSEYLSEQSITADGEYAALAKEALKKEHALREMLGEEETKCFEELFDITSQIHFLEVKDAFSIGCKLGADASKGLSI